MENLEKNQLIGISALLVHAAKVDDNYTDHEKKIIKEPPRSILPTPRDPRS